MEREYHNLLRRQIKRFLEGEIPEDIAKFINAVNLSYKQFDIDRQLLERSLEISSDELIQLNSDMDIIFKSIPDVFFRVDTNGVIIDQKGKIPNEHFAYKKGRKERSIVGFFEESEHEKIFKAIELALKDQSNTILEITDKKTQSYFEARFIPSIDNHVIIIIRDISKQITTEKEREELETQLLQSQRIETMGTLAGGIAHNMNNLLTPILGYTEFLKEFKLKDPEIKNSVESIAKATIRARDLVRQILIFSQKKELVLEEIFFDKLLYEIMDLLRATIPKNIDLNLVIKDDNIPAIMADASQMYQIVVNLCTNAQQAIGNKKNGKISLSLELPSKLPDLFCNINDRAKYICLKVSDNGAGMKKEVQERVFEPFFTTKSDLHCSGLGLSVIHGILVKHQGYIHFESEPGKGSTFFIYLGLLDTSVNRNKKKPLRSKDSFREIVFVDDEEMIVDLMEEYLGFLNYKVKTFTNPKTALKYILNNDVDLLITDQSMPEITGTDLVKKLRDAGKTIPVILVTGYDLSNSLADIERLNISTVLEKPFEIKTVNAAIKKLIKD